MSAVYAPQGKPLQEGDIITMTQLSNTLNVIATEGVDAFYTGTIAQNMIHDIQSAGGNMTLEDLAGFNAIVWEYSRRSIDGEEREKKKLKMIANGNHFQFFSLSLSSPSIDRITKSIDLHYDFRF